ncbi:MAG: ABC transporter permease [Parvibaculum sp.]|nr:ABC transporter permease [Parvibaculum sp.]
MLTNDRRTYPVSLSVVEHTSASVQAEAFSRAYADGDEDAAIRIVIAAFEAGTPFAPPFESLWWLCGELLNRRRYRLGLELTECVGKHGYRGWRSLYLRGIFLALTREIEPAAEVFDSARRIAPVKKQGEIALLEGRLRAMAGQTAIALRLFRENLRFDEAGERFVAAALRIAHREGERDLVVRWAEQANAALGVTASRMRLLAEIHYESGEWQKARDAAERGTRIDPKNVVLCRIVARSAYREGRVAPAITQLQAQLGRDGEWTEGKILLCRLLIAGRRDTEARRVLKTIGNATDYEEERRELRARLHGEDSDTAAVSSAVDRPKTRARAKSRDVLQDPEVKKIMSDIPADFAPRWTPETLASHGNSWVAIKRLSHSVRTLMLREMMARFGRHEIGYLWAILEPMMHVAVFSLIFYFIRARDSLGMNVILFVATGVIPLFIYLKTYNHLTNALKQNRPLLNHSRVQPMDIYLARALLELFTHILVFIVFVSFIYMFVDKYSFGSAWSVLSNMFGLWIFGIGAGLALGSLVVFAESIKNVMDGLNRLIYITSGVFFTLDMMPASVAKYLTYNPLLHFVDGVRGNFNPLMGGSRVDFSYGIAWAVAVLVLGLVADRALRRRVLDR